MGVSLHHTPRGVLLHAGGREAPRRHRVRPRQDRGLPAAGGHLVGHGQPLARGGAGHREGLLRRRAAPPTGCQATGRVLRAAAGCQAERELAHLPAATDERLQEGPLRSLRARVLFRSVPGLGPGPEGTFQRGLSPVLPPPRDPRPHPSGVAVPEGGTQEEADRTVPAEGRGQGGVT